MRQQSAAIMIVALICAGPAAAGGIEMPPNIVSQDAWDTALQQSVERTLNPQDKGGGGLPLGAVTTITSYKDWRLICGAGPHKTDTCDLVSEIIDHATNARLATIRIGRESGTQNQEIALITVPLTVHLKAGIGIRIDSVTHNFPYATCLPQGCVVIASMDRSLMHELAFASAAELMVEAENGQSVPLQLSLDGFSAARKQFARKMRGRK